MIYKQHYITMLYLGGDHAGYTLKEQIKKYLEKEKIQYQDLGPLELVPTDDYPDYGFMVAKKVASGKAHRGILICGSSAGVCIVANKVKGIRAAAATSPEEAEKIREHNDANVLCLSGWKLASKNAARVIKTFLETKFSEEERHKRRIRKIKKIENLIK